MASDVTELSGALLEKAAAELKEKPEWRERDIQAVRDMLQLNKGEIHCWTKR